MILFDTPYEEVFTVMFGEYEKVKYAVSKASRNAARLFTSVPPYPHPAPIVNRYTIPASRNNYVIVSVLKEDNIENYVYLKSNGDHGHQKVFLLRKNNGKKDLDLKTPSWVLDVYTGHFLSRYRERAKVIGLSGDDLIVHFLEQNSKHGTAIPAHIVNPAEKGVDSFVMMADEGVCFMSCSSIVHNGIDVEIDENKTFVSKDSLYFTQLSSFLTTDYFLKMARIKKAQNNGASDKEIFDIIQSGIFQPIRNKP